MTGERPRISIVVPNLNRAATLGRTLESLFGQEYPRLEVVVIDGGSRDESTSVIRRYERLIFWWVSESDRSQTHALNKGLARCTGDVASWLCSDDFLLPGALATVGMRFAESPALDVVAGGGRTIVNGVRGGTEESRPSLQDIGRIPAVHPIFQPSCFWRRRAIRRHPPLDESFDYAMDFELWAHLKATGARWGTVEDVLSVSMITGAEKTSLGGSLRFHELERIRRRYGAAGGRGWSWRVKGALDEVEAIIRRKAPRRAIRMLDALVRSAVFRHSAVAE